MAISLRLSDEDTILIYYSSNKGEASFEVENEKGETIIITVTIEKGKLKVVEE